MDLLSEGNVAGKNLLSIVSRGSAIIAEMLRLSENIPPVFLMADKADQAKYGQVLFDFSYLRNAELHESRIGGDIGLSDLDEELRESNMEIVERFYRMFESVYKYIVDLNRYLEDVDEGVYIQMRLEDLLVNDAGKQLLSEAIYLYGVMLTIMDSQIEGPVRERMLISYYRYKGSSEIHSKVCNLCRSTGYLPSAARRPPNYPEELFSRCPPPKSVVSMVVNRLRSDDIYNQMKEWPNPDHRSTALQSQAAMVFVILFFVPEVLHKEGATMREIVDKHLSHSWVLPFYMGFIVDLSVMWEPYKAAMTALNNTVESRLVKEVASRHAANIDVRLSELSELLTEGTLTEEYVLDNTSKLLNVLRVANAELRWLMLHRKSQNKRLKEAASAGINPEKVLLLLVHTAQLEFLVGSQLKGLMASKETKWESLKRDGAERMGELSSFFSGAKELTRVKRDERLEKWFATLKGVIESLDHRDSTLAGRKIQQLMTALDDVGQFHQVEDNTSVKLFLTDAILQLKQMIRLVNIKEDLLIALATISDFSFGFGLIKDYISMMHALIKRDPFSVLLLRATFLKLASVLDLPLVRINQVGSDDLVSVAQYYSSQLVDFLRNVLEVVPVNMFVILNDIIQVHTGSLKELPPRFEKQELREYAQMDERYLLARATQQVSVLTKGILAMEATLLGIVEADPKKLLEDGIRKELVKRISVALHNTLVFPQQGKPGELEGRLDALQRHLEGFRRSFEYISDYVNIYGLKIWQEEFGRIVNFSVEQECNAYLKKKIYPWQSHFQSKAIPIPVHPPLDEYCNNFIGRLVREVLSLTDVQASVYLDANSGWFEASTGKELLGIRTCSMLHKSVGTAGVRGIDTTLAFLIVSQIQKFVKFHRGEVLSNLGQVLEELTVELGHPSTLPAQASKLYAAAKARTAKAWPGVMQIVGRVGQAQLLRRHLASQLNFSCRLDSPNLSGALEVVSDSLTNDICAHYQHPDKYPYPKEESGLLGDIAPYLDTFGLTSPVLKIYITTEPLPHIAMAMFVFCIASLQKYTYDTKLQILAPRDRRDACDATPFVVGVITLLKQFHSSDTHHFIQLLCQHLRCLIVMQGKDSPKKKEVDLGGEAVNVIVFLQEFCKFSSLDRKAVQDHLPPYVFDKYPV